MKRHYSFRHPSELSKRAVEVLRYLKDHDEDLVSAGHTVWYGLNRTNWSVLNQLLECSFVSQDQFMKTYYSLNGSGIRFLEGLPPYLDENGVAHEDANTILQNAQRKQKANQT